MTTVERIEAHEKLIELLEDVKSCERSIVLIQESIDGFAGQNFENLKDKWLKEIMVETAKKDVLYGDYKKRLGELCGQ